LEILRTKMHPSHYYGTGKGGFALNLVLESIHALPGLADITRFSIADFNSARLHVHAILGDSGYNLNLGRIFIAEVQELPRLLILQKKSDSGLFLEMNDSEAMRRFVLRSTVQMSSGHVWSHVWDRGLWFNIDDALASLISVKAVVDSNSFLLFYEQVPFVAVEFHGIPLDMAEAKQKQQRLFLSALDGDETRHFACPKFRAERRQNISNALASIWSR